MADLVVKAVLGLCFLGWLAGIIGMSRIVVDTGMLDYSLAERMSPQFRAMYRGRFWSVLHSEKHRLDRLLLIGGAAVFFGTAIIGVLTMVVMFPHGWVSA